MNQINTSGYAIMLGATLLLITMGGLLAFAPRKFLELGRWWGRRFGFRPSEHAWQADWPPTWLNFRLPGIGLLCFGLFLLFKVVRSIARQLAGLSFASPSSWDFHGHHTSPLQLATGTIPIFLGIFALITTNDILSSVKQLNSGRVNFDDQFIPVRILFRTIGFLAIVAGFAFLLRRAWQF